MINETFDFVVVGSGAGSMCAALVLRKAGKSVLVLEKADLLGGTTATSGGVMWIPNNRFMKQAGIDDSREKALAYLDAAVGDHPDMPGASRARREAFVDEGPQMIDFLVSQGIRLRRLPSWPDHYKVPGESVPGRSVVTQLYDINQLGEWKAKLRPGFLPLPANLDEAMELPNFKRTLKAKLVLGRVGLRAVIDRITKKQRVATGQALQAQLLNAALKAGTEVRVSSPVKQLLVENDRVVGVLTQKDGADWRVGARLGVLINAGGFAHNQGMRDRYVPGTLSSWSLVQNADTGEMIEEGQRVGGALAQMGARIGYQVAVIPGERPRLATMQGDMSKPHAIVVDQTGVRYQSETGPTVDFCTGMLERNKTAPAVPSWLVVDSQYMDTYMLAGTMPASKKPQAWFDSKFLRQGDTLEALAVECGMDAAKLKASVERFNGFVKKGVDDDFHRGETAYEISSGDALHQPLPCLGTLERGPFFAMQIFPGDVSTMGGLVTDTQARVLRADGSFIPGLYATGTSTASIMGMVEGSGGGSIGPTMTWGYVAAKHALSS